MRTSFDDFRVVPKRRAGRDIAARTLPLLVLAAALAWAIFN